MTDNNRRDRRQANDDDVDGLINALNAGRPPEVGDDPELASLLETARALQRAGDEPEWPAGDFPARLANQLFESLPARSSAVPHPAVRTVMNGAKSWNKPALDIQARRRDQVSQRPEPEEMHIMSDLSATNEQPATGEQQRWSKELWKVAAAIIAFAAVGALLVLVLHDNNEGQPQIVQPGPTASPAATGTQNIDLTPTASTLQETVAAVWANATAEAALKPPPDWSAVGATGTTIALGGSPFSGVYGAGSFSVFSATADGSVNMSRIDPATNSIITTIPGAGFILGASDAAVYVWLSSPASVGVIDPATNQFATFFQAPDGFEPQWISAADNGIWVSNRTDTNKIFRFDPDTGELIATIDIQRPGMLAATHDAVWVSSSDMGTLTRIDPATNAVIATIKIIRPGMVEVIDGDVWVSADDQIMRIDQTTNSVAQTYVIGKPGSNHHVLVSEWVITSDSIWAIDCSNATLYRTDRTGGALIGSLQLSSGSCSIDGGAGSLWVPDSQGNTVIRITPNQ